AARRDDPARGLLRRRLPDRVDGTADLERADRLERLELQPDLGRCAVDVEPNERRPHRGSRNPLPRPLDLCERDQNSTVVPVAVSCARRTRYSAAYRSSTAIPSDRKTVSSSDALRPAARPLATWPSATAIQPGPV